MNNNQINLIDMIQEVKAESLTIRTEVINREVYPEELEVLRLEAELNEYRAEYEWFKETLHTSCMPEDEKGERLEQAYDGFIELREDLEILLNR